ncbi:hypothetical protein APSETT444_002675 [Aspergillus pseudonomiae]
MAVEDAATLSKALTYVTDKRDLRLVLQLVEKLRSCRTKQVQQASLANGRVLHLCDGPEQEARDNAMRPSVEGMPLEKSPYGMTDRETQAWCYGHDVQRDFEEAWEKVGSLATEKLKAERVRGLSILRLDPPRKPLYGGLASE